MTTDHCNGPECWVCHGITDELIDAEIRASYAQLTNGGTTR